VSKPKDTKRAALPLGIIAATFFLPVTDACNKAVSPFTYVRDGNLGSALWVLPTFVAAAVLVTRVRKLAFGSVAALVLSLPVIAVLFAGEGSWLSPVYGAAAVASAWLLTRALLHRDEERDARVLDAFAVAAFPLAVVIADLGKYVGGYLFMFGYAALATQRLLLARRGRAPTPSSDERVRVGVPVRVSIDEGDEEDASQEDLLEVPSACGDRRPR
jgi:hypothetical protein